jgi:hypothetical protein
MATSGNIEFDMNRTDFLEWSLRTAQLVGVEQAVSANLTSHASKSLNMLLATWEKRGRHLWTAQSATVFLSADSQSYDLGTSGDYAVDDDNLYSTTISADEAAAQTVLSVTATTGFTAADIIGIVLDDNTMHWTTIVSKTATTVTITDALASAASSGNDVYVFTTKLAKPLRLTSANLRTGTSDRICEVVSREEYLSYPNKASTGSTVKVYYDPKRATTGKLYVWPASTDSLSTLKINYQRSLQAFDAAGNTGDLPKNWYLALAYGVAALVCPAVGKDKKAQFLASESERYFGIAQQGDHDEGPSYIYPGDE